MSERIKRVQYIYSKNRNTTPPHKYLLRTVPCHHHIVVCILIMNERRAMWDVVLGKYIINIVVKCVYTYYNNVNT